MKGKPYALPAGPAPGWGLWWLCPAAEPGIAMVQHRRGCMVTEIAPEGWPGWLGFQREMHESTDRGWLN